MMLAAELVAFGAGWAWHKTADHRFTSLVESSVQLSKVPAVSRWHSAPRCRGSARCVY